MIRPAFPGQPTVLSLVEVLPSIIAVLATLAGLITGEGGVGGTDSSGHQECQRHQSDGYHRHGNVYKAKFRLTLARHLLRFGSVWHTKTQGAAPDPSFFE